MIIFLSGGVRSGKSSLAEKIADRLAAGEKIYLATSKAVDEEMSHRIRKHRQDRSSKNFRTIEQSEDVSQICPSLKKTDTILFDCLGNLLANEMFSDPSRIYTEHDIGKITQKIYTEIDMIDQRVNALILVSNEIFSDGVEYEEDAEPFLKALAALHIKIAGTAAAVIECVHGSNIVYKNNISRSLKGII